MHTDFSGIQQKIEGKLPDALPKIVKWIVVHLLMLFYHIRMPVWVTVLKFSKARKAQRNVQEDTAVAQKRRRRRERHRMRKF